MTEIRIKKLANSSNLPTPEYATAGSAGMDLIAAIDNDIILQPGARILVPTGISLELPLGIEAQVRPRSGLAIKNGVTVLNSPGTVDSDYRGEVAVILINHGQEAFTISRGMRIAQMIISKHERVDVKVVDSLSNTERGEGGFGSTGTSTAKISAAA